MPLLTLCGCQPIVSLPTFYQDGLSSVTVAGVIKVDADRQFILKIFQSELGLAVKVNDLSHFMYTFTVCWFLTKSIKNSNVVVTDDFLL